MYAQSFEEAVVWHCAPALVGLKSACLMSLSLEEFPALPGLTGRYNALLGGKGPRFLTLCQCRKRMLLLVYREEALTRDLAHPKAQALLTATGYPAGASLSEMLRRLMGRLEESEGFPHEIGLFLGYPPEDVEGFLTDVDGTGCKLRGCWKVYHDVEGAKRQFQRFHRCRDLLWERVKAGATLAELLGAANPSAA